LREKNNYKISTSQLILFHQLHISKDEDKKSVLKIATKMPQGLLDDDSSVFHYAKGIKFIPYPYFNLSLYLFAVQVQLLNFH